jgi:subtilisin family serine protease
MTISGAGQTGLILQRGGEELRLEKVANRFTLRLAADIGLEAESAEAAIATLRETLNPESVQPIPGNLWLWTVSPRRLEAAMIQARAAETVAFVSHSYRLRVSRQTQVFLTDQVTVQFAPGMSADRQRQLVPETDLTDPQPIPGLAQAYVYRVAGSAIANPIKLANRLMQSPEILVAEPNVIVHTEALYRPVDPLYSQQWHLHHTSNAHDLAANSHISAETAWGQTRGSRSVVIAVSDDGFDLKHPDFQGLGKIVAPRNLRQNTALPLPELPIDNHGTAVAGLAIAEENGVGVVGVAPGCAFMPIQTTGYLDDESIEQVFNWAKDQGAAVISCSWSAAAVYFPLSLRQRNAITQAATQGRQGKGCVVVFSAGNANRPVSGTLKEQGWPRSVLNGTTTWLSGFAVHPDVITVSASTSLGRKAAYSNWGQHIAVAAPSNNGEPVMALPQVGQVKTGPTLSSGLPGRGLVTSDRTQQAGYSSGDYVMGFGGTSGACPVVAGVAGLMLSANPDLTARQVRQLLQQTADKITDPNPDPQLKLTHGRYDDQGHSLWFGHGKVNAAKAVQAALDLIKDSRKISRTVTVESSERVAIPDHDLNGVTHRLRLRDSGPVQELSVTVEVEHDYLGDLSLTLISPQGSQVLLQGRNLGRQTRLHQTYTLATTLGLRSLIQQPAGGEWGLKLIDHAPQHQGALLGWQLRVGL